MRPVYLVSWTDFKIHKKTVVFTSLKAAKTCADDLKEDAYASQIRLYKCIPIEE